MKNLNRLIALVLALLMAASLGSFAAAEAAQGDVIFKDLEFSWYKNYDWYSAETWGNGSDDQKEGEKYIIDNFGIQINFQDAGGAATQKLATMMIDNEYPDVITLDRDQNLQKLITSGALVPLDPYLDKYPNLRKYLGDDILNMFRAADGNLYTFPNWAAPLSNLSGNRGWLVQKKYYDALGQPELKTYDDLYNYLALVKENFPGVIPLEIGSVISAAMPQGMPAIFGGMKAGNNPGYLTYQFMPDGDGLKGMLEDEQVQKTLLYLNKLYREKLMTQDSYTMTADDLKERIRNGRVAIACIEDVFDSDFVKAIEDLKAEDPTTGMFIIDPIVSEGEKMEDVYTNYTDSLGWNVSVITKDAKDPEAIFAYLDWWFGNEGQLVSCYGFPGGYYELGDYTPEGYPVEMNESFFEATNEEVDDKWLETNWVGNTSFVDNMAKYIYETTGKGQQLKIDQFNYTWNHSVNITELANIVPDFDTPEGILYQNIDNIYAQAIPTILAAGSEEACKAEIEKYIAELKDEGLAELLAWQTDVMQSNKEKLGID